jgi:FixJ family two-component response regulator
MAMFPQTRAEATVYVVDDDAEIRKGVTRLAQSAGFSVKSFATPGDFLLEKLASGPSCVVLDMCMDGLSGLEVQDVLRVDPRQIPIVFLSGHGTIPAATTSMKHGAGDFLEKPFRPTELLDAISRAVDQDKRASKHRLENSEAKRLYGSVTAREREVFALVVAGLLNKQIAAELGISEKTVKVHRARVMEKMQVESLADLVRLAEKVGIEVSVPPEYQR